eukprot:TRINITY_DN4270_c0_g2_i1.p2 TRINITY_DN4270_c0_g2~~TRINITY_DN4270_c0_g2_i1.p2  ORF type:complete len:228 (+),score=85.38 TRINITY_DN4270_c0_g2_i1:101-784(+)
MSELRNGSDEEVMYERDEDRLSSLLFPDRVLDPEYEEYLSSLASYSFDQLAKEPSMRIAEGNRIKQEMEGIAFKNYKSFIHASDCVTLVHQGMSAINVHLNSTLNNLNSLHESCANFVNDAQEIRRQQSIHKVTLLHNTSLTELLEIPQLMDTFIHKELYEEALQLERHTAELKRSYGNNKIIVGIAKEVEICTNVMLRQLHDQLRSKELQLPQCMKVMGYLRRLGY